MVMELLSHEIRLHFRGKPTAVEALKLRGVLPGFQDLAIGDALHAVGGEQTYLVGTFRGWMGIELIERLKCLGYEIETRSEPVAKEILRVPD